MGNRLCVGVEGDDREVQLQEKSLCLSENI